MTQVSIPFGSAGIASRPVGVRAASWLDIARAPLLARIGGGLSALFGIMLVAFGLILAPHMLVAGSVPVVAQVVAVNEAPITTASSVASGIPGGTEVTRTPTVRYTDASGVAHDVVWTEANATSLTLGATFDAVYPIDHPNTLTSLPSASLPSWPTLAAGTTLTVLGLVLALRRRATER